MSSLLQIAHNGGGHDAFGFDALELIRSMLLLSPQGGNLTADHIPYEVLQAKTVQVSWLDLHVVEELTDGFEAEGLFGPRVL